MLIWLPPPFLLAYEGRIWHLMSHVPVPPPVLSCCSRARKDPPKAHPAPNRPAPCPGLPPSGAHPVPTAPIPTAACPHCTPSPQPPVPAAPRLPGWKAAGFRRCCWQLWLSARHTENQKQRRPPHPRLHPPPSLGLVSPRSCWADTPPLPQSPPSPSPAPRRGPGASLAHGQVPGHLAQPRPPPGAHVPRWPPATCHRAGPRGWFLVKPLAPCLGAQGVSLGKVCFLVFLAFQRLSNPPSPQCGPSPDPPRPAHGHPEGLRPGTRPRAALARSGFSPQPRRGHPAAPWHGPQPCPVPPAVPKSVSGLPRGLGDAKPGAGRGAGAGTPAMHVQPSPGSPHHFMGPSSPLPAAGAAAG